MCIIRSKSSSPSIPKKVEEKVVRHQADHTLTKTSIDESQSGYRQNQTASPIGLTDDLKKDKKTLLGE